MWWLVVAFLCSPAWAAEGKRELAFLFDAADPVQLREQAMEAIRAQLTDVPVQVTAHTLPTGASFTQLLTFAREGTLGAFWVSVKSPDSMGLYFLAPGGERIVSRWVSTAERARAVGIEEMAVIVRSSVQSLLGSKDFVREMAPAAVPLPVIQVDDRVARVRLSVAYEGSTFAPQVTWVHGLKVGASAQLTPSIHLGLNYTVVPSLNLGADEVAVNIVRRPIELVGGFRFGKTFRAGVDLGAQADIVTRFTQATSLDWTAQAPSTRVLFSLSGRAVGAVQLGPWAQLYLSAGVEGVLNRFDFVAETSSSMSTAVITPWALRVVAGAGASVAFF